MATPFPSTPGRLILRWIVGMTIGTAFIAVTSPWFVRSYLPYQHDSVRGVQVLEPGNRYRWRSEGYAESKIGPLGMVGFRESSGIDGPVLHVAFWGDSQAEGVCVEDQEKIAAIAERRSVGSPRPLRLFPLARSADDLDDWIPQIPRVEAHLPIDAHVILIVDLADLLLEEDDQDDFGGSAQQLPRGLTMLPAFVLEAGRRVLREADGSTPRSLRFRVGPRPGTPAPVATAPGSVPGSVPPSADWQKSFASLRQSSELPIVVLYASTVPHVASGSIIMRDPDERELQRARRAAEAVGIALIDLRAVMRASARRGEWPRGFHNGQIGSGHLNATGNRLVAEALVMAIERLSGNQASR